MPVKTKVRLGDFRDLLRSEKFRIYHKARERGYGSLTDLLEDEDPTPFSLRVQGQDAFTRLLALEDIDINPTSDPYGRWEADTLDGFLKSDAHKALFPEWVDRQWKTGSLDKAVRNADLRYQYGELVADMMAAMDDGTPEGKRAIAQYLSSDFVMGTVARPFAETGGLDVIDLEPAIPLTEVIAMTRTVQDVAYRKRVLVDPPVGETRMLRIAEGAEIPTAKIAEAQRLVRLHKFGRALEITYEAARRLPLNDLAIHIRRIRLQTEVDQVAAAIDVMINGDGNAGSSAIVHNLTSLDAAATPPNITLRAWLAFKLKWRNPYNLTAVLAREAAIQSLLLLNVGTANVLAATVQAPDALRQAFTPINTRFTDGVRFGVTDDVPANRIVGFDGRFSVEHLQEAGSVINESERFITRQTEKMTLTLNEGFSTIDPNGVRMLNLDA